jgi:acylphosphatase
MIARNIMVEGHVQGVFFREWTLSKAREHSVTGWVRNRQDGRVEIYAVGQAPLVKRFVERMHEGSPASRVDRVDVQDAQVEKLDSFMRRQTV